MSDTPQDVLEERLRQLLLALNKAEQDDKLKFSFIALKWFRDTYLPQLHPEWATSLENRRSVLLEATSRSWIATSRIPNPKAPDFPTTTLLVNRGHPEVRKILESAGENRRSFTPRKIEGEPLSRTVIEGRR